MYLCNQSCTHKIENHFFQKFSCQNMATKEQVLAIFSKVIGFFKKTDAKKFTYFRYNIWDKVRGLSIVSKVTEYLCNQSRKKSFNITDFQQNKCILVEPTRKNNIFKESDMRKFHFRKTIHIKVRVIQIFSEAILYK